jgi:hypothetical protein
MLIRKAVNLPAAFSGPSRERISETEQNFCSLHMENHLLQN